MALDFDTLLKLTNTKTNNVTQDVCQTYNFEENMSATLLE